MMFGASLAIIIIMNKNKQFVNDMFYNMPVRSIDITCVLTTYSVDDIANYVNSLNKLYKIDATRAKFIDSFSRVIILHYLLFLIHDSRFIDHIVNLNRRIDIPEFIIVYLAKITPQVNSKNSINGSIKGHVSINHDPTDFSIFLKSIDEEFISKVLLESGFNSLNSKQGVREIVSTVKLLCKSFEKDTSSELYDEICSFLSDLPLAFYRNDLPMWVGFMDTNISNKLGIYRFRNCLESDQFLVNQKSCDNFQDGLLNLFCCFLKIYSPVFLDSDGTPLPHSLVPGEAVLDVSDVSIKDVWTFYLSGTISHGKRGLEHATNSTKPSRNDAQEIRSFSTVRAADHWAPTISASESIQVISHSWLDGRVVHFLMRDPCSTFKRGLPGLIVYEA